MTVLRLSVVADPAVFAAPSGLHFEEAREVASLAVTAAVLVADAVDFVEEL